LYYSGGKYIKKTPELQKNQAFFFVFRQDLKGSRQDLKVLPLAYSLYFAQFALPFRSICTTFSLREKVLSFSDLKVQSVAFSL
jgi:hypothetical protein